MTCMMGVVGRERGFQLLSLSVTDKPGAGTIGRWSSAPSNCLVVKPTAGALNDKRRASIMSRKSHFGNWLLDKEGERGKGTVGVK